MLNKKFLSIVNNSKIKYKNDKEAKSIDIPIMDRYFETDKVVKGESLISHPCNHWIGGHNG
jgi:hypothetical protein